MQNLPQVYVGVDVSKKNLDVHIHPINKNLRVKNDEAGINKLLGLLGQYQIEQVVFEASGGYELLLLRILQSAQVPAWRVEPRRIKGFIRSEGKYAKTDACDAKMIALFAAEKKCNVTPIQLSQEMLNLKALVTRRHDLCVMIAGEKTRLQQAYTDSCKTKIKQAIEFLSSQQDDIEKEIQLLVKMNDDWKQKAKLAQSMKGIGPVSAAILIAELPELGLVKSKPIAALVGVAPFDRQSGNFKGNSHVRGGRSQVRRVLYMAGLCAARSNPIFKNFYNKLREKGKKPKVAIIAVVRKMIVVLNAMFKSNTLWKSV